MTYILEGFHYKRGIVYYAGSRTFVDDRNDAQVFHHKWNAVNKATLLNGQAANLGAWFEAAELKFSSPA